MGLQIDDGWMNGFVDGWMDGWMGFGWMDRHLILLYIIILVLDTNR